MDHVVMAKVMNAICLRSYACTGHMSEWAACSYTTAKPKRRPFVIPEDQKATNTYLASFEFTLREVCCSGWLVCCACGCLGLNRAV